MAAPVTIESIVNRYRREATRADAAADTSPELELRFQDVSYASFAAIHEAALKGGSPATLTQMVSTLMTDRRGRSEAPQDRLRPAKIREIYFEGGAKVREQLVRKEPLVMPLRMAGPLPCVVALSEEQRGIDPFSIDEGALIRAKARASFVLAVEGGPWRLDLTVTRQLAGSDAGALPQVVAEMFRTAPPMTPATLLKALGLADDANPAPRELYRYEVEAEYASPDRDGLRPAAVTAAAAAVLRLADPDYLRDMAHQAEVYRIAKHIVTAPGYLERFATDFGLKRLLPQALAITRADYREIYPPAGYYVTDKADGKRAVAVLRAGRAAVVADVLYEAPAPAGGPPAAGGPPPEAEETIVDGELVGAGDAPAGPLPAAATFYGFDVIAVGGERVAADGFGARAARLAEAVALLRAAGLAAEAKPYERIGEDLKPRELEAALRAAYERPRPYEVDGLILVEPDRPYAETRNYKWKSARDNTIDFLARRAPASARGRPPYADAPGHKLHFLFVGIAPELFASLGLRLCPGYADLFGQPAGGRPGDSYFPVQFAPSSAPYAYVYQHPDDSPLGPVDGKIVEARCGGDCEAAGGGAAAPPAWELVRLRDDRRRDLQSRRYFGNDFYSAELIWLNYVDPFPIEQLWEGPAADYFMRAKSGAYRAQTAVVSFMKSQRIAALKHANWVLDLGAGKGQDLGRYRDAEVANLVAVDGDRAALAELIQRNYDLARGRRGRAAPEESGEAGGPGRPARGLRGLAAARPRASTAVHVLAADLTAPSAETLARLERLGLGRGTADAVVCNLAVHYFLGSAKSMRDFVALAQGAVRPGGTVVVTALLGEEVHALFQREGVPEGGTWDVREGDTLKFSLRRLYSSDALEVAGQRIGVLLPFSDGRYYEEFLVNFGALAAEFLARGFQLASRTTAAALIPDFEARNRVVGALLTPGDRRYLELFGDIVLVRK